MYEEKEVIGVYILNKHICKFATFGPITVAALTYSIYGFQLLDFLEICLAEVNTDWSLHQRNQYSSGMNFKVRAILTDPDA